MLMRIASFGKEAMNITIHNQYPNLELTSPVYYSNGTTCHVSHSQQVDTGNIMKASFGIGFRQKYFKSVLLCRLQIRYASRAGNQLNSSIASINDTATNVYLLVVLDAGNYDQIFYTYLIECADDFSWDEDKLWMLHRKYNFRVCKNYKSNIITWLMHGSVVMKIRRDVTYGSDYKLNVFITEGAGSYNVESPVKIELKGLVLSLSMLITLIVYC
jgi:hypothetical protein